MKKTLKAKISEAICFVPGIAFAIVGLYYFHMQYINQTRIKTFSCLPAQIIQHEVEHCDGVLI